MNSLENKVALITGGCSGIGLASAIQLAQSGARVVVTGCRRSDVEEAVKEIGFGAIGFPGSVTDIAHYDAIAKEIVERFGGLDVYMTNAEVTAVNHCLHMTESIYDAQFGANTKGVFFGVQKMAPIMRNGGAIIITGSIACEKAMAGHAVYAGSKAAIFAFVRSWAIELKSRRIRVNVLSPSAMQAPLVNRIATGTENFGQLELTESEPISLGRIPDESGGAARFLASDSSIFTGTNLSLDGEMSLL